MPAGPQIKIILSFKKQSFQNSQESSYEDEGVFWILKFEQVLGGFPMRNTERRFLTCLSCGMIALSLYVLCAFLSLLNRYLSRLPGPVKFKGQSKPAT